MLLEKPTGLDVDELVRIRDAVKRAGVRTIVSFELRYNPFLKFAQWMRNRDGSARSVSRACSICRGSPTGIAAGAGWDARERPQPPAGGRLPRRGRAALVLRPRAGRGQRLSYALHRRLRVADVDCRQHDARRRRARTHHQLDRLHDALHVHRGADGRPRDDAPGPDAVAEDADRPRGAQGGEPVPGRAARGGDRSAGRPGIRIRCRRCRIPRTSAIIRSRPRSTSWSPA